MSRRANKAISIRLSWINCFIQAVNAVDAKVNELVGLNVTQCRILFHVAMFPGEPIGNVASSLSLKPSTTTAAVNSLVEMGFITREKNDIDLRNICICLTDKGIELSTFYIKSIESTFNDGLNWINKENRNLLRSLLYRSSVLDIDTYQNRIDQLAKNKETIAGLNSYTDDEIDLFISHSIALENICYFLVKLSVLFKKLNLSQNEGRILFLIFADPSIENMKFISAYLNIRPNVCTVSVSKLLDKGLVLRARSDEDKRSVKILLTQKGKSSVNALQREFCDLFDSCFPKLIDFAPNSFLQK